jgi:acetylornithine deacetylase/succinyl-diaminopimelate desuccinylase-like protein
VDVLTEGVHSGDASGVVASSFRIARQLIERIENMDDGSIKLDTLNVEIPRQRSAQARAAAAILGPIVAERFPFVDDMKAVGDDRTELLLNRTWRPALSITGVAGLPHISNAGNVLRPGTQLQLSLRTPPTVNAETVYHELKRELERDPPYGATVSFEGHGASGWHAPMLRPWLHEALDLASNSWFDQPCMYMGEGGTIPFMGMLGEKFPHAQFIITGVLGPGSNAHGPNEFLHLTMAKQLTGCVAQLVWIQGQRAAD